MDIQASVRALSVVNDSVAWLGGTGGTIAVTTDKGAIWKVNTIAGCPKCDFRTLYAWNATTAIVANAGNPAVVYKTQDGGTHWEKVHEVADTVAFIDGVAFWDEYNGLMFGDPIDGRLMLLRTMDGGRSWCELPFSQRPVLDRGEASFAASGTTMAVIGKKTVVIATGGATSRLLLSKNRGRSWRTIATPIIQGKTTQGIFSLALVDRKHWYIAGGDYLDDTARTRNFFYTTNAGKTWQLPVVSPNGYSECITPVNADTLIIVRPNGMDLSTDKGKTWRTCNSEKKLHVMKKARTGSWMVAAGGAGKVYSVSIPDDYSVKKQVAD